MTFPHQPTDTSGLVERLNYQAYCAQPGSDLRNLVEEAAAEITRLQAESAALTKALTGLTCGGSEFFNREGDRYVADIEACVAYVQRGRADAHRRFLEATAKLNAVTAFPGAHNHD